MGGVEFAAGVPGTMNYQGKLSDSEGNPVRASQNMIFAIYSSDINGVAIWSETQNSVAVNNGIFEVELGSVEHRPSQGRSLARYRCG